MIRNFNLCGLTVLLEELSYTESVSIKLYLKGGLLYDTVPGQSLLLAPMLGRGAGDYDSRALQQEFDLIGASHSETTGLDVYSIEVSCLKEHGLRALQLLGLMVKSPRFAESELASLQALMQQEYQSIHDNPMQIAVKEMLSRYHKDPFNRSLYSTIENVTACTVQDLRNIYGEGLPFSEGVLSIAGNFNSALMINQVNDLFMNFVDEKEMKRPEFVGVNKFSKHIDHNSAQTQIVMSYPAPKVTDGDYYVSKVANGILSSSMSGRLFVEVREKRGLCYSVGSSVLAGRDSGRVQVYAGTTPDRAEETLKVTKEVLKLNEKIQEDELARSKISLISGLFVGSESSNAHASFNGTDFWHLGRVRSREEIKEAINKITIADIEAYLEKYPVDAASVLTLGSKSI